MLRSRWSAFVWFVHGWGVYCTGDARCALDSFCMFLWIPGNNSSDGSRIMVRLRARCESWLLRVVVSESLSRAETIAWNSGGECIVRGTPMSHTTCRWERRRRGGTRAGWDMEEN